MNDPTLSKVLKWSIENSSATATAEGGPRTKLTAEDLAAVMGQVTSEPQQMDENMAIIRYPGMDQANRIRALLNYQQIIENLDNANLMQTKGHWEPMVTLLEEEDDEIRRLAAWCLGTAVQNNRNTQERVSDHFLPIQTSPLTVYSSS
jgi:hsp70-interacting protein